MISILIAATIWNSLVAWAFIGLFCLIELIATGNTALHEFHFIWWGLVLAIGYVQLLRDEVS